MQKILIAVDDTKGTQNAFTKIMGTCKSMNPGEVILVYVEKLEGRSLMDEMLGDAEMSTLKEALEGTEVKEALDRKADAVLHHYRKLLESGAPALAVKTVVRTGHPAEEILKAAEEEGADLIVIGTRGRRLGRFFLGSVSREVADSAKVSTLLVR